MKKVLVLFMIAVFAIGAAGQSFEDNLKKLAEDNAKGYVTPLVTGFGVAMNSGLFKKAKTETGLVPPVGADIGLAATVAIIPETANEYSYDLSSLEISHDASSFGIPGLDTLTLSFGQLYNYVSGETATISSDKDGAVVGKKSRNEMQAVIRQTLLDQGVPSNTPGLDQTAADLAKQLDETLQDFRFPDGLNLMAVPMLMPQANLRVRIPLMPVNLELSLRGLPEFELEDVGTIAIYGGGLRSSLPVPIINVAVGGYYQLMKIGDFYEATNMNIHAEVGKSLGALGFSISPYIGAGLDQTNVTLSYNFDNVDGSVEKMEFSIDGENSLRYTTGLTLQIPFLYLNAEVAQVGDYQSGTLSLGVIFK
jgi:hypothetical protein